MVAPSLQSKKRGRIASILSSPVGPVVGVFIGLWLVLSVLALLQDRQEADLLAATVEEFSDKHDGSDTTIKIKQVPGVRQAAAVGLENNNGKKIYDGWRELAMTLARFPPAQALQELKTKDPFGMREFEKSLVAAELAKGSALTQEEFQKLFSCPTDRITLPDQRDKQKLQDFRAKKSGSFLFFQHLRKAGGTDFCELAQKNLRPSEYASYYCMSDFQWAKEEGKVMAGYLHHWSNEQISRRMKAAGHRITGNEWDNFDRQKHFELPAIFATTFRRPLDRALSQFRFECMEDRGCKTKDPAEFWSKRPPLYNVYTTTFADADRWQFTQFFKADDRGSQEMRAHLVALALDTVSRFHLVLVMEWLSYSAPHLTSLVGWTNTEALTSRVRPHITQAKRQDGQDVNALGAAGIAKASWIPEEYLTPEQYKDWSESLVLDEILTDAARRIFLERLVCPDVQI